MYFVILATVGIMLSGIIMTFNTVFPAWMKQIAQPIHRLSVFTIVAWLFIHVYMGAVFPEEKEAFFSMFSGKVSAWYAKAHHEKWYLRCLTEEVEWEEKVLAENREASENKQPAAHPQPSE
jgi:formate dehydrogenase subunit gamma